MSEYYIGLMSGTSMDGIDAALVKFSGDNSKLVAHHSHSIPAPLKEKLKQLSLDSSAASIDMLGEADSELGTVFAEAVNHLLKQSGFSADQITAIGSHGQTIRHRPDLTHNFSLQIADANRISYVTGITTVADFRRKDMAAGGEGAPLAPAFHQQVFHSATENRAVLNIGGISNLTFLPKDTKQNCCGFDTGPGNILMDSWIHKHKNLAYDQDGQWAAGATADKELVKRLMQDAFISKPPPKSTGREHYNLDWLEQQLKSFPQPDVDQIQASLCQFSCDSIVFAIKHHLPNIDRLIICGGGTHNSYLMKQLSEKLPQIITESSQKQGIDPDWVEAIAFAWLAKRTINNLYGNLPAVTGARQSVVLGAIYPA